MRWHTPTWKYSKYWCNAPGTKGTAKKKVANEDANGTGADPMSPWRQQMAKELRAFKFSNIPNKDVQAQGGWGLKDKTGIRPLKTNGEVKGRADLDPNWRSRAYEEPLQWTLKTRQPRKHYHHHGKARQPQQCTLDQWIKETERHRNRYLSKPTCGNAESFLQQVREDRYLPLKCKCHPSSHIIWHQLQNHFADENPPPQDKLPRSKVILRKNGIIWRKIGNESKFDASRAPFKDARINPLTEAWDHKKHDSYDTDGWPPGDLNIDPRDVPCGRQCLWCGDARRKHTGIAETCRTSGVPQRCSWCKYHGHPVQDCPTRLRLLKHVRSRYGPMHLRNAKINNRKLRHLDFTKQAGSRMASLQATAEVAHLQFNMASLNRNGSHTVGASIDANVLATDPLAMLNLMEATHCFKIIWDSGASLSISHDPADFVNGIQPLDRPVKLEGIAAGLEIKGQGTVHWCVLDVKGRIRVLELPALYIPLGKQRLLSITSLTKVYQGENVMFNSTRGMLTGIRNNPSHQPVSVLIDPP